VFDSGERRCRLTEEWYKATFWADGSVPYLDRDWEYALE